MKTTRFLLLALLGLLGAASLASVLLAVSLPLAPLFEYTVGTLVTAGLFTIQLGTERAALSTRSTAPRSRRVRDRAGRTSLAHAV